MSFFPPPTDRAPFTAPSGCRSRIQRSVLQVFQTGEDHALGCLNLKQNPLKKFRPEICTARWRVFSPIDRRAMCGKIDGLFLHSRVGWDGRSLVWRNLIPKPESKRIQTSSEKMQKNENH